MILRKRYKRDIRHNLSLYVSATILTVLSLLLFYLYEIAGSGILDYTNSVFQSQKIEDAHFNTYMEIPEEQIEEYEEKYDLELEKQKYLNIETDGITSRVFQNTEKIDLAYVTEGKDVSSDDEVVISEGYAVNKGISLGDTIKIREKEYTISGFVERPDYLVMLQNLGDTDKNVDSFYICYMTDHEFESLGETNIQYLVRYEKENHREFRKDVHDNYMMRSYTDAKDNLRITMMTEQPEIFLIMAYFILVTFPLLTMVLISVILSRKICNEQKMIGTLSAYGYTKGQLIRHYAGFSAIPGIFGGILTTLVVAVCAEPYGSMGLMDYEPLDVNFALKAPQMILGVMIPTMMYMIATVRTVSKLLKNDITVLLNGAARGKNRVKKVWVKKEGSIRKKFTLRSLLGNPGRTCILFFGVFLGSFIILWALACLDTANHITTVTEENMGDYNYQYVLGELNTENKYGGETMLAASVEDEKENVLSFYGADGNSLVGLRDPDGNKMKIDDGYLITSLYAKMCGVKIGEQITVFNPMTMEKYQLEVSGIVENNYAKAIYTSRKHVSELMGMNPETYNVILSREQLDIPEENLIVTVSRDKIADQYEAAMNQMETVIHLFAGVGVIFCLIAVYITVNMTVTENRRNISMLSVLGYHKKKIRKMLLHDHIYVVIPAILLSIPCAIAVGNALFLSFAEALGYLMEIYIRPSTYLLGVALILGAYIISSALAGRKISRVDMVESLKDSRE